MKTIELTCPICNNHYFKSTSHYNRAVKLNAKMYCSKACFSIGRKLEFDKYLKTPEQLKEEKAQYDRVRRKEKREELKIKAQQYNQTAAGRATQKRSRQKLKQYHVEYCRKPEQRTKERLRNRRKKGLTELKTCLCCNQEKQRIEFEAYLIFPDKRLYMCKDCEQKDFNELNITLREVLATIRSVLVKTKSNLKVKDIAKYPYLIEAHKYSLLLKRLTK